LNGHGDEVASIEAALVKLGRDREAARREIEDLKQRRHQALLDDATDAVIDRIERDIDHAATRIEKLDVAEAPLRARLAAAKATAHRAAITRHFEIIAARFGRVREAILAAEAEMALLMQERVAAGAEVGEHVVNREIPVFAFAGFLGLGFVPPWVSKCDAALAAARAAREGSLAGAPAVPKLNTPENVAQAAQRLAHGVRPRLPHERQQITDSQRGETLSPDAGHARPTPRSRPPDDLTALQPGEVRVKVLRAGFSPRNDLAQCAFGQIIKMPRSAAERVEGIVQILERYDDVVTAAAPAADAGAAEPAPSAATPDELRA